LFAFSRFLKHYWADFNNVHIFAGIENKKDFTNSTSQQFFCAHVNVYPGFNDDVFICVAFVLN